MKLDEYVNDDIDDLIEDGVGKMYAAFYRLREGKQYQREYDVMGTIMRMLQEDRHHLRQEYEVTE
jgi:hypothetical protein